MEFKLKYDKGYKDLNISTENFLMEVKQNNVPEGINEIDELRRALENPISSLKLSEITKKGEKIAIITSDITRPVPSKTILPLIIEEILKSGVAKEDITIVFALGIHRSHTVDEMKKLVGEEIYNNIECVDGDINTCIRMGYTKSGTPIDIVEVVAKADRRICIGNIEYHYFAGYSGGAKAVMPGVSSRETIKYNHSKMVLESSRAGNIETNSVRLDLEDAINIVPIDFILNVVLDSNKKIIKAVAGHYLDAHRVGCEFLDSIYKIKIPQKADIVIVTPGGYPKDINLYQAQKALDNGKHAVRDGGIIILVASCKEQLGEDTFEKWIMSAPDTRFLIEEIERNFELGGHKAAAIAMVLEKVSVYMVSDLNEMYLNKLSFKSFDSVNDALSEAYKVLGQSSNVIVMTQGGSTLPVS